MERVAGYDALIVRAAQCIYQEIIVSIAATCRKYIAVIVNIQCVGNRLAQWHIYELINIHAKQVGIVGTLLLGETYKAVYILAGNDIAYILVIQQVCPPDFFL